MAHAKKKGRWAYPKRLLPIQSGRYRYVTSGTEPKKVRGDGWVDTKENRWVWKQGISGQHCAHWDVEHPNEGHSNIAPDGEAHHGYVYEEYF
jgi:hypothetical protein